MEEKATASLTSVVETLATTIETLLEACHCQLSSAGGALPTHPVCKAGDDLLALFLGDRGVLSLDEHGDRGSQSFASRALDRGVALLAMAQSDYMHRAATSEPCSGPYAGLLVEGAALLRVWSPAATAHDLDLTEVPLDGWKYLRRAIVADAITLIAELRFELGEPVTAAALANQWTPVVGDLGGWLLQSAAGEILDAAQVASRLRLDRDEIESRGRRRELLVLEWWDGTARYPAVQFAGAHTSAVGSGVWSELPRFLKILGDRMPLWQVAIWLSRKDADGHERAPKLEKADGCDDLLAELDMLDSTTGHSRPVAGNIGAPTKLLVAERERSPSTPLVWTTGTAEGSGPKLFRINQKGHGPVWFSRAPKSGSDNGGRFDLAGVLDPSGSPQGTCYLAHSVDGAASEVFQRSPVLVLRTVLNRNLWTMRPMERPSHLLDLTDKGTQRRLRLKATTFGNVARRTTQNAATRIYGAGFRSVRYHLSEAVSESGVAIFGPTECRSAEVAGHGTWLLSSAPLATSTEFWEWVEDDQTAGIRPLALIQLPGAP